MTTPAGRAGAASKGVRVYQKARYHPPLCLRHLPAWAMVIASGSGGSEHAENEGRVKQTAIQSENTRDRGEADAPTRFVPLLLPKRHPPRVPRGGGTGAGSNRYACRDRIDSTTQPHCHEARLHAMHWISDRCEQDTQSWRSAMCRGGTLVLHAACTSAYVTLWMRSAWTTTSVLVARFPQLHADSPGCNVSAGTA